MPGEVGAIVFDLFRTLIDPEAVDPGAYHRVDRLTASLAIDVLPFQEWWGRTRDQRIRQRTPTLLESIAGYCERQGTPRSPQQIERALSAADAFHDQALLHPHEHVLRVLRNLRGRGFKIGILSNTDEHEARLWSESPFPGLVDAAGLSAVIGLAKPEPEAYRWILRALGGIDPHRAIFVGDGESHELRGAKQAGFGKAVFLREFVATTGFQTEEKLREIALEADASLEHLVDLEALLG